MLSRAALPPPPPHVDVATLVAYEDATRKKAGTDLHASANQVHRPGLPLPCWSESEFLAERPSCGNATLSVLRLSPTGYGILSLLVQESHTQVSESDTPVGNHVAGSSSSLPGDRHRHLEINKDGVSREHNPQEPSLNSQLADLLNSLGGIEALVGASPPLPLSPPCVGLPACFSEPCLDSYPPSWCNKPSRTGVCGLPRM